MKTSLQSIAAGCFVLIVLLSGCSSVTWDGGSPSPTPDSSPSSSISESGCAEFVTLGGWGESIRDSDEVTITYEVTANASVFFVVFENDTVLGIEHVETRSGGSGIHADGHDVSLDRKLEGNHTLQVVAYSDTNANGQFDPEVDQPCRNDGEVVQSEVRTLNFSTTPLDYNNDIG